ncbi:antibiotic biosynthesis monooxygenase [Metabacillus sp. KIGAM252]|uniref:Antibiotic biosynthesis monooxygenase n=1 Tax=Metabacillus flavus TaxID=2823519 RepID=A0ABS5LEA9_9BACI|nr:putative quinol monooxygenase [Metabacillus flavus]MBS2969088.1 antibiotic biosynthesis monooxygenase [Metabacillus flavus]
MIITHAGFQVRPDKEAAFLEEIQTLVKASQAENGCISYRLMKNLDQDHAYTMVEVWEDMTAVKSHGESEHFVGFVGKAKEFLSAPLDVKSYEGSLLQR